MIKRGWIGALTALLMTASVLLMGFLYLNAPALASVTGTAQPAYVSAMDKEAIIDIQIVADEKQWADMLENATDEEYIPATIIINGEKIENAGIRPKGNSSLSTVAADDTTDRYSFKIEFDHYITGQTWKGLDKLVVNNMQGDASYMKEYLSYDIMSYAGVDVPLYAFADISVNGESWGFYLAVETMEDSYAQRVFGSGHGQLYKPESMGMRGEGRMNEFLNGNEGEKTGEAAPEPGAEVPQTRPEGMEGGQNGQNGQKGQKGGGMASGGVSLQYTDDELSSYSAIFDNAVFSADKSDNRRVISALKKLSEGEDLENTVDVEAVLRYFAAHNTVVNLDSYTSNMGHNYYLYEDEGRLSILPWDYNLSFGGFQSGSASEVVNLPIDTPVSGVSLDERPLLAKLLEVPEYLEQYHGYLREIAQGYFGSGTFERTVDSLNELISAHVKNDPTAFYDFEAYTEAVKELKKLGLLRAESIVGQLDGKIPSTSAGQSEDASALVDASDVNLSAMGSQGGGGAPAGQQDSMPQRPANALQGEGAQGGFAGDTGDGNTPPGGYGGGRGGGGGPPGRGGAAFEQNQTASAGQTSSVTWIYVGGCAALTAAGIAFVTMFRRRRYGKSLKARPAAIS